MFFPLPLHQNCFVKGTTGTHAATPSSHLSVLIYLSSHRSRARSSLPSRWLTVFTWLLNCAPLVVLSPHWLLCLLFCFFLFLPTNNNGLCFKAQSWHPIILFLHHLPSESQSFKHHLCFFALFVLYKVPPCSCDTKILCTFPYFFIIPYLQTSGLEEFWNSDGSRLKKGDVM